MVDAIEMALAVAAVLERCGVSYTIGGSLASSFSGEPRASIDLDIVVDMRVDQADAFVQALGEEFYADVEALRRVIRQRASTNLIHRPSGFKIDLFVAGTPLEAQQLERRRRIRVASGPDRFLYVHTPEDILLQKLRWYQMGGEVSERQWRDVVSIVIVQGARLDRGYLLATAAPAGLSDLLERAERDAAGGGDH